MFTLAGIQSEHRDNLQMMMQRKTGEVPMQRLTRGAAEVYHLLSHQLNSLPEVQLPPVQNIEDGTFAPTAGWDFPQP